MRQTTLIQSGEHQVVLLAASGLLQHSQKLNYLSGVLETRLDLECSSL